jgi:hypothetical protein
MKKRIEKKMALKETTVVNLDHKEKQEIKGGISFLAVTCDCNTDHESCSIFVNCCPPPKKAIENDSQFC